MCVWRKKLFIHAFVNTIRTIIWKQGRIGIVRIVSIASILFRRLPKMETIIWKPGLKETIPLVDAEYKDISITGTDKQCKATLKCKLRDVQAVEFFVRLYMERTNETLRKLSPIHPSQKNVFASILYNRCHHKTKYQPTMNPKQLLKGKPSKRLKNTDCPFSMVFKVKREIDDFPCVGELAWNHNHPVQALQALSFKDIPAHVIDRIRDMYDHGYTPGLAYEEFMKGVRIECQKEVEFHWKLADCSKVPRRRDFNQL